MKLDRVAVAFKVGDKFTAPGKEQLGLKHGMPICYIDEAEWGLPLEKIISKETTRIFNIAMVSRAFLEFIKPKLSPTHDSLILDPKTGLPADYRPRPVALDFSRFLSKTGVSEATLLSKSDNPGIIDASSLSESVFLDATTLKTDISIMDINAVSSGSYTVGSGGDYATWALAFADVANLTGDLTFTQISDVTETATASGGETLGGHTLTTTNSAYHSGVPGAGNTIHFNHADDGFYLNFAGTGILDFCCISMRRIAAVGLNRAAVSLGVGVVDSGDTWLLKLRDLLIDGNSLGSRGISLIRKDTVNVEIHNVVAWSFPDFGVIVFRARVPFDLENLTIYNCGVGIGVYKTINCKNIACFDNTTDFASAGNADGDNNASSDATAADGNWSTGNNNLINQVAANCFKSTNDADDSFLDITGGGPLDGNGVANTLTRPTGIRGRAVPGPSGTSIGAAEVPAWRAKIMDGYW